MGDAATSGGFVYGAAALREAIEAIPTRTGALGYRDPIPSQINSIHRHRRPQWPRTFMQS